jgi:hypothetical protein
MNNENWEAYSTNGGGMKDRTTMVQGPAKRGVEPRGFAEIPVDTNPLGLPDDVD